MEKNIKLKMCTDKVLQIFINDEEKHSISAKDRSITAEKIYEIIGFSIGDHYTVTSENEDDIDEPVLDFFTNLFNEIIKGVNALSTDEKG